MDLKKRLKNLASHPGDSISQRVVKSGVWSIFFKIIERAFRFIRTVVLARLLAPADFGLFGIACIGVEMLEQFAVTGVNSALVQKKGAIDDYLDTAWTIAVLRGLFIALALIVAAPYIALFFNNAQVTPLVRVIALSTLIAGFINTGVVYFVKDIDFRQYRLLSFGRIIAEFITAVTLAFLLRSAWALAWSKLVGALTHCFISYRVHPYRPRLHLDIRKARELFRFGRWIFFSTILGFAITQGDDIFVGKFLGTQALGMYGLAYAISNLGTTEIVYLLKQIMFPAYAKIQDDIKKLRQSYLKVLQIVAFLTIPLGGIIFVLGHDFTRYFLGAKWLPMVAALQILAFWGIEKTIGTTASPIFQAIGKPHLNTKLELVTLFLLAVLIYPLSKYFGIRGTSFAVLFSSLPVSILATYLIITITKCGMNNFSRMIAIPAVNTVVCSFFIMALKRYMVPVEGAVAVVAFSIVYGGCYLALTWAADTWFDFGMFGLIKGSLQKIG